MPRAEQYRTASFRHRGHELVYDVYGEGDCLLVYTHGLLLDADLNRGIAAALAERGNRVVLLDLLGHGRSDKPTRARPSTGSTATPRRCSRCSTISAHPRRCSVACRSGPTSVCSPRRSRPERVRALVLEMPVLEWAVPSAAMTFVPILLAAHYGRPLMGVLADVVGRVPRRRSVR